MSVNVKELLDGMDSTEAILRSGYNWREKAAREIFAAWRSQPRWRRAYWSMRGRRPV
jgi:hypothetical protein